MKRLVIVVLSLMIIPIVAISTEYHENLTLAQKMDLNEVLIEDLDPRGPVNFISAIAEGVTKLFNKTVGYKYDEVFTDSSYIMEVDLYEADAQDGYTFTHPIYGYVFIDLDVDYYANPGDLYPTYEYLLGYDFPKTIAPDTYVQNNYLTSFWQQSYWMMFNGDDRAYSQYQYDHVYRYGNELVGRSVIRVSDELVIGFVSEFEVITREVYINTRNTTWHYYNDIDDNLPFALDIRYIQFGVKLRMLIRDYT